MWSDALPRQGITNWQVFYGDPAGLSGAERGWQSWTKPAGCSWVYIYSQGSGGGGGRPANGATTVGGGGGGCGSTARILIPAFAIPDTIYVRPGVGGAGATTANAAGGNGTVSAISMQATPNTISSLLLSQNGGQGGAASTTGGSGGTAATQAPAIYGVSLFSSASGNAGGNGATISNGNSVNVSTTTAPLMTTQGSGGGNGNGNGGSIVNNVSFPTMIGGAGANGTSGLSGFRAGQIILPGLKSSPLIFSGGTGGGGHTSGTAGSGGAASYGGGGGGGGGCNNVAGTSGNGGNGGNGFIMIGAF